MGQFKDESIKNVIDKLNQSYFLPDIQREYVWDEKQIKHLFDSILKGYPIGSFLFWKLKRDDIETNKDAKEDSGKLNFQLYKFIENYDEREKHNEKINIEQINADDLSIVLDGQQRLTSLYAGLKGTRTLKEKFARKDSPDAYKEKHFFLNLRYQPGEETPDDNFKFEFLRTDSIPEADENNFWFKVGEILELDSIVNYARKNDLSDSEARILETLKNAFCVKNLISYFEETDKNLDKVLQIFIRVNSGGTHLSYSDLLMSILTANFSGDIRTSMNEFVDSLRDKQGFGIMGRDQVLKTCLLLTDSKPGFQLKNFSKSNIKKIEEKWEEIQNTIFAACDLLEEFGYANRLSSAYILSIVAYYIFKKGHINQEDKNELLKFVRNAQIKSYFSNSLDTKLEAVAKIVRDSDDYRTVNAKLASSEVEPLKISNDDIDEVINLHYGNSATFSILQILYPNLDYKNSTFHIDHIFPKSKFNNTNTELPEDYIHFADYLCNLQLLEGGENIAKKDKDPEQWLKEHFSGDKEKIKAYKERNYIKEDFDLEWGQMEEFEKHREEAIIFKLKKILLTEKEMPVANNV